jgi:hypothetical protein
VEASASVPTYSLSAQLSYYQDGVSAIPLAAGYYTVSAVVSTDDYTGTSVATLSVLDLNNYYTLPISAIGSFVYTSKSCDTTKDIVVSFDYALYGEELSGSEGFCIAFTDTSTYNTRISGGAPGKGLTYTSLAFLSAVNDTFVFKKVAGRTKGCLGIGFDILGNYGLKDFDAPGFETATPNSICIRDSYLNGYRALYRTPNLSGPSYKTPINLYQNTATPEFYSVRARLTNIGRRIIVDMKKTSEDKFINYLTYDLPAAIPAVTNVSLGYSTGFNKPTFKIKNFNLNCFTIAITATPYDLFSQQYGPGPGEFGGAGITFNTIFYSTLFLNPKTISGLPYTMTLYYQSQIVGVVLFDAVYLGEPFALVIDNDHYLFSNFSIGDNYLA